MPEPEQGAPQQVIGRVEARLFGSSSRDAGQAATMEGTLEDLVHFWRRQALEARADFLATKPTPEEILRFAESHPAIEARLCDVQSLSAEELMTLWVQIALEREPGYHAWQENTQRLLGKDQQIADLESQLKYLQRMGQEAAIQALTPVIEAAHQRALSALLQHGARKQENDAAPLFLSIAAAARRLGISERKLYPLVMSGEIPSVTIGRRRLIAPSALEAYARSLEDEQEGHPAQPQPSRRRVLSR